MQGSLHRLANDPDEKSGLILQADQWYEKAMAVRKQGLPRAAGSAVLEGRISRADGSPAGQMIVTLLNAFSAVLSASSGQVKRTLSDALGNYRLEGLPPGNYYVMAGFPTSAVFYPGTSNLNDAIAIAVNNETVVVGIDFRALLQ